MRATVFPSIVKSLGLSALTLTVACGPQLADEESAGETQAAQALPRTRNHIMPLQRPGALKYQVAPAGAHLNYYGGPTLSHVHVTPVYWNAKVGEQSALSAFYAAVTSSPYFDMLTQYGSIGRGSAGTAYVDRMTATKVTDAQIQTELTSLIMSGQIPAPDANSYYPVHFPPGVDITDSGGTESCVTFCAYHGTFVLGSVDVNYGVIPDQGGPCAGGCGADPALVNNLTSVSSCELVEATTDPAVGLAVTLGEPLAWYDPVNGEIGDICNTQQGTTVGGDGQTYVVQKEFSNAANDCVVQ